MLSAAVLIVIYGQLAASPWWLLALSRIGYVGHGYSHVREFHRRALSHGHSRPGQGLSYNAGRLAGALAPFVIGALAENAGLGLGLAIGSTSAFFSPRWC